MDPTEEAEKAMEQLRRLRIAQPPAAIAQSLEFWDALRVQADEERQCLREEVAADE